MHTFKAQHMQEQAANAATAAGSAQRQQLQSQAAGSPGQSSAQPRLRTQRWPLPPPSAPSVVPGSGAVVTSRSLGSPAAWRMALISDDLPAFCRQRRDGVGGGGVSTRAVVARRGAAMQALCLFLAACPTASLSRRDPTQPLQPTRLCADHPHVSTHAHRGLQVSQQLPHASLLRRADHVHCRGPRQAALHHPLAHPALQRGEQAREGAA